MKKVIGAVLIAVGLLGGCSGKKDFPEDLLRKFVAVHKVSLQFQVGKVARGGACQDSGAEPGQLIEYVAAEKLGFVTIKPEGKDLWQVELTDAGRSALKRQPYAHTAEKNCDYQQVDYPLATKELVAFNGTEKKGSVVETDYTWKWVPTDSGNRLASAGLSQEQIAELNHALGYQVHQEDYFTFPLSDATHPAKQGFEKEGERWKVADR